MKIARKHLIQVLEAAMELGVKHFDYPNYSLYARKINHGKAITIKWFARNKNKKLVLRVFDAPKQDHLDSR
jgi:hypothetical protein